MDSEESRSGRVASSPPFTQNVNFFLKRSLAFAETHLLLPASCDITGVGQQLPAQRAGAVGPLSERLLPEARRAAAAAVRQRGGPQTGHTLLHSNTK